ncbi:hypothetical protein MYSTI_05040 [Myxococcus stipitatus DSM 14675]|uniref:Lipoprotein n=1 Tax=Myxococcus stipitatus (strain DSM 14675 / JCM 12634 / Mx s8) TaxID=1278073 RepID=L7UE43_MYXSD|nr:hypothetical protein [Myxococcus stipitatus]AGC46328.1 hypothetical protein MYSTI_05040 [Myxococcus stipitatus DSM 14675]
MNRMSAWMPWTAVSLLVGCGGALDETASPVEEALIEQTVVWVDDQGVTEHSTRFITRAEQQAQFAARAARREAPAADRSALAYPAPVIDCNNQNSLWLFDRADYLGRQLCLYRRPGDSLAALDLGKTIRYFDPASPFPRYWAGAVRSLSSGSDKGQLSQCDLVRNFCSTSPFDPFIAFNAWQNIANIPASPNTAWLNTY